MRLVLIALVAVPVVGCGNQHDGNGGAGADMAVPGDLATPDLAAAAADLAPGGDADGGVACAPAGGAARAQWVWNDVRVPLHGSDYAVDLNGDGHADDQLGNIEGAFASQGFDPQASATAAVQSGQSITLIEANADDATFGNDACAASDVLSGTPTSSPDFSGAGHFTPDGSTPGHFAGPLVAGRFTSEPEPPVATVPSVATVRLPLFGASSPVRVVGARLTWLRGSDGKLSGGQLNGAITKHDVDTVLVPNLAAQLTAEVQANPGSSTSQQLLSIFDTGGTANPACAAGTCKNLDGSCAVANDGKISDCELASSSLIQNLLAPDVQLFDASGNYHPNPANTNKDSLSIGIGFTAVPATF